MRSIIAAIYEENHHSQTLEFFRRIIMTDYLCMMIVVGQIEDTGILSLLQTSMNIVHTRMFTSVWIDGYKTVCLPKKDESS